tara:strand:- start:959 stop:1123 length:165 start_codon:yes stop_codon:yes gene_type:complete
MENLKILEIKPFVPANDFKCSKRFYQLVGFELVSEFGDIAYFKLGDYSFLLQGV